MGELQKMPYFGVGKDFETAVTKLENDLKSIADGEVVIAGDKNNPIVNNSDKIPINHFFMDGVYIRKMTMYKGYVVIGAIHKHKHMCFLLSGYLTVTDENGKTVIQESSGEDLTGVSSLDGTNEEVSEAIGAAGASKQTDK